MFPEITKQSESAYEIFSHKLSVFQSQQWFQEQINNQDKMKDISYLIKFNIVIK